MRYIKLCHHRPDVVGGGKFVKESLMPMKSGESG